MRRCGGKLTNVSGRTRMSDFLQQIPAIVGPASIMVAVHYWYRRGRRPSAARRSRR
jgi:hypothetical protein